VKPVSTPASASCPIGGEVNRLGGMMLAIVIVTATLSVVGVISYIFYLTPGPNDHI
jgi:hypothetical protein